MGQGPHTVTAGAGTREDRLDLRALWRASAGGVADDAGITDEKIERNQGVFRPCPSDDHNGTPRLFEEGAWNPIARGNGRISFPDGKARSRAAVLRSLYGLER